MTTGPFAHEPVAERAPRVGLIVLRADETIEYEFRRLIPAQVELMVSRVPSGDDVTPESLEAMAGHMRASAALFPGSVRFAAIGYGCTSGTAQIGAARVADLVSQGARTDAVSDPLTALIAACRHLGVTRLGVVSPYVADVSDRLRAVLAEEGISTPVFGSFEVAEEARVARIDGGSIRRAAAEVAAAGGIDAVFLSCTNLRALDLIERLAAALGLPVLSSNQVLGWHLLRLAGAEPAAGAPGRLFARDPVPAG